MKKFSALLLPALIAASCSQKKEEPPVTIFSGKITNPKSAYLVLFGDTIPLDSNGTFFAKVDSAKAGYGSLEHGSEYTDLFISPGDSLYVTFNTEEFDETMHYEGKGAEKNNFLAQMVLLEEKIPARKELFSLEKQEFLKKTDSLSTAMGTLFDRLLNSVPDLPGQFIRYEKGKILYSHANNIADYPGFHSYYTTGKWTDDEDHEIFSKVQIEDTSLLGLREYQNFLKKYSGTQVNKLLKADTTLKNLRNGYLTAQYKTAKEKFSAVPVKEYLLYDALLSQMRFNGADGVDSLLNDFKSFNKNEKYSKKITEAYNKWLPLAKGNPAPGFNYVNIKGDSVSLASMQGKLVYIDVWATWCGPCKAEIPHLEKVQKEFSKENIAFVSVSIDDDRAAWEKMVKEKSMKGIQLFAHGAWKSDIAEQYNVSGIPRFILIGKKGEIIDANAPRPSDEKLKELFRQFVLL